jgi:NADH-ubiquinone oxidoreductase chain 2
MFTNSINNLEKKIHSSFINRITILTLLLSILYSYNTLYFQSIGKGISLYSGLFQNTVQSQIVEIVLIAVGISIIFSWPFLSSNNRNREAHSLSSLKVEKVICAPQEYSLIAIFSILGGSLLMSSLDLLSMYLSIELQSFALYILATLNKERLSATSAGLKYFLLGSLSSCLILLGSAIIYSYTGLTQFESINTLMSILNIDSLSSNANVPLWESLHTDMLRNTMVEGNKLGLENTSLHNILESVNIYNGDYALNINKAFTIGLIILIIGFLFKISAAPFYQWAPDVYDGTPTIVTVWLTIVVKLTILIFLLGFIEYTVPDSINIYNILHELLSLSSATDLLNIGLGSYQIKNLLLISSLLSLLIGTIAGLSQIKFKRLLAFSSISHVGFLLLALGIYTQKSVDSFLFYLIQYSLTSLNIFLILLAFGYLILIPQSRFMDRLGVFTFPSLNAEKLVVQEEVGYPTDINYIVELKGQLYNNPILSISIAICLFSMAGVPPLIGFFSKQFVLFSSIENGNNLLSIVAILVSVISASYYLKLIKITFFEREAHTVNDGHLVTLAHKDSEAHKNLSQIHSYIIAILTLLILFFFLDPSILLNGTQLISLTIFNI